MHLHFMDKLEWTSWEKNKVKIQSNFAPQQRSYGIVALPSKYQNVRYWRATLLQLLGACS